MLIKGLTGLTSCFPCKSEKGDLLSTTISPILLGFTLQHPPLGLVACLPACQRMPRRTGWLMQKSLPKNGSEISSPLPPPMASKSDALLTKQSVFAYQLYLIKKEELIKILKNNYMQDQISVGHRDQRFTPPSFRT